MNDNDKNFSNVPLNNQPDVPGNNNDVSLSGSGDNSDDEHGLSVPELDFTLPCIII